MSIGRAVLFRQIVLWPLAVGLVLGGDYEKRTVRGKLPKASRPVIFRALC